MRFRDRIGYLLRAAPERALETLMQLTTLLRGVLKRSEGEFATLGQELDLVSAYLAIERERFEERLQVALQVPAGLRSCLIPSLVVQPLAQAKPTRRMNQGKRMDVPMGDGSGGFYRLYRRGRRDT